MINLEPEYRGPGALGTTANLSDSAFLNGLARNAITATTLAIGSATQIIGTTATYDLSGAVDGQLNVGAVVTRTASGTGINIYTYFIEHNINGVLTDTDQLTLSSFGSNPGAIFDEAPSFKFNIPAALLVPGYSATLKMVRGNQPGALLFITSLYLDVEVFRQ